MITCKQQLDQRNDLQPLLFRRGFLLTDQTLDTTGYPFYGNWSSTVIGSYTVYVHRDQRLTVCTENNLTAFLIGHAYNPYSLESDEIKILKAVLTAEDRLSVINQLTGIFFLAILSQNSLECFQDAAGQQQVCYGFIRNHLYLSSHMRLIGDLLDLQITDYADRLIHYRWYPRMMGNYLPGDLTGFAELTRMVPNTSLTVSRSSGICAQASESVFKVTRFYPAHPLTMCGTEEDYRQVIAQGAQILHNTMALIPQKWNHPTISLTGGIDSNTTFAAANGHYDQYAAFSYVSIPREEIDAEKAEQIATRFSVPWKRYDIPQQNTDIQDFELIKAILIWNAGGISGDTNLAFADSDTRKKITLIRSADFDVEVKSWISETVRAYAYKYFGRTKFPKDLSARNYTSMYKLLLKRRLVRDTDKVFRVYLQHTALKDHLFNYDETDLFVWEIMQGGKESLDIGTMKTCFDITIPYNNRNLLDLLLRVPLEKRLNDQLHLDLKKTLNQDLFDMNIRVINANETDTRKKILNAYFTISSHLPF